MMKVVFLVGLAWTAASALGCECAPLSLNEAKEMAEVVFRGTITDIRAGNVSFRVKRVWKGDVGRTFDMPDFTESAACIGFLPKWLQVGNDLLVFAARLDRYPGDNDYFTSICSRTSLASEAGDAFERLGRGKLPRNVPVPKGHAGLFRTSRDSILNTILRKAERSADEISSSFSCGLPFRKDLPRESL
jgi:hypothetical protein